MASESYKTSDFLSPLFTVLFILAIIDWGSDAWHSKARYAVQYGVSFAHVTKQNKPHDCDWLTAPMGKKNCHYDPQVQA